MNNFFTYIYFHEIFILWQYQQHYFVFISKPLRKCHEEPKNELDKIRHLIITLEDRTFKYQSL